MNGDRKIQINDGQKIDLLAQTNDDFTVTHSGLFTRIHTWFGVEVEFYRRKPNKYMEIKTYLQPYWQSRLQTLEYKLKFEILYPKNYNQLTERSL